MKKKFYKKKAPPDSRPTSEKDTKKSLPRREEPHQESAMDEQQECPDSRRTTQGRSTRDPEIAGVHLEQSAVPFHTGVVGLVCNSGAAAVNSQTPQSTLAGVRCVSGRRQKSRWILF
ncbi:uncharacterized protein LOC116806262 isoform X1 [Drosophila grimshawi]|uniref:uncharacterized protein LOC116806262 isoform X1 n=1 Tax=Drosophila grimshawi TaxID=7222 RepID=UPI001C934E05|nr:uncharacterized protein LOC116806262 isoform X1 [Drosophila grimshawi]